MTQYIATINVPGYLPTDMDVPAFDTAQQAWEYLAGMREQDEDQHEDWPPLDPDQPELGGTTEYSATHNILGALGEPAPWRHDTGTGGALHAWLEDNGLAPDGTGFMRGETPGYSGDHDLGLVYRVIAYTADAEFVTKLEQHTAQVHMEYGQPVAFSSPDMRDHMDDMLALPFTTSRDADVLTRSNWRVVQADLTDRFPDDVEDHRFGHWAFGWVERLYVRRGADVAIAAAQKWVERLEGYPVADESDFSELESEEIDYSIGDYLASAHALNVGDYGKGAELETVHDLWYDFFGYPERETVLRYLFAHNERMRDEGYPEHTGTDVNWDTDLIEDVVTEWLLWVLDPKQHGPEPDVLEPEPEPDVLDVFPAWW